MNRLFCRLATLMHALALCALGVPASAQFETRTSSLVPDLQATAVGDFNHDGKRDLAVAAGSLEILLGNGDGTFQPPKLYSSIVGATSVAVGDFNHDGNLDLALATYLDDSVTIMLGNGDGSFTQGPVLKGPASPMFVALGDFNHDNQIDIASVENGPGCKCIAIFLGNGDGTFQPVITTPVTDAIPGQLAVGDFDGDGQMDVAVTEIFGSIDQVSIWLGNGDGTFREGQSYALGPSPAFPITADFNRDDRLDLAVPVGEGGAISVLLGNGDGTFQPPVNYPAAFPGLLIAVDLDGDHKLDLVTTDGIPPLSGVSIFKGQGDGTFSLPQFFPVGKEGGPLAVGDFNGDGKPDIQSGNGGIGYVSILLNTGTVAFSPTTPLSFKKQPVGTTSPALKVRLTNKAAASLRISSMRSAGEFAMTSTCHSPVAAGATCSISVTFSPKSKGAKSGTVVINDSASSKPMVIELSGTGT